MIERKFIAGINPETKEEYYHVISGKNLKHGIVTLKGIKREEFLEMVEKLENAKKKDKPSGKPPQEYQPPKLPPTYNQEEIKRKKGWFSRNKGPFWVGLLVVIALILNYILQNLTQVKEWFT